MPGEAFASRALCRPLVAVARGHTPALIRSHDRPGIAEYWSRVTGGQEQVRFDHDVLAVDGEMGIARWRTTFYSLRAGSPVELDGIFAVRAGPDGTCTEFREISDD